MEKRPYVPPEITESYEISPELKGRGVFYDAHEVLKENGELSDYVYKEFHLDLLFSQKGAVELFSKQEEEHEAMKPYFPEEMLPKTIYLVQKGMEPTFEMAKLDTKNIYPYRTFWKIQANRRLAGRYGLDERHKGREEKPINALLLLLGEQIEKVKEKKFAGALIQERINGIPFGELMKSKDWKKSPNYEKLRENVRSLIEGLRKFHENEERVAYTWHSFDSDNVMVETDEKGEITGRVAIIDTNFTQRPDTLYQKSVIKKLEESILKPLEKMFEL